MPYTLEMTLISPDGQRVEEWETTDLHTPTRGARFREAVYSVMQRYEDLDVARCRVRRSPSPGEDPTGGHRSQP